MIVVEMKRKIFQKKKKFGKRLFIKCSFDVGKVLERDEESIEK